MKEPERRGDEPDVFDILSKGDSSDSQTAKAKARLERDHQSFEVEKLRHSPGLLGWIFGGQANSTTYIIGAVALMATFTIMLSIAVDVDSDLLEVSKAIVFLALGAFGSKKIGSE